MNENGIVEVIKMQNNEGGDGTEKKKSIMVQKHSHQIFIYIEVVIDIQYILIVISLPFYLICQT